jgi:CBS domain-containing protein
MNCPSCGHENIDGSDRCENCLAPFRDLDVPRVDSAQGLARSVMEDNLSELDHDETIFVAPDTPANEVARLMKQANLGCALVLDRKKLVGIFTEHDVLLMMAGSPTKLSSSNAGMESPTNLSLSDAGAESPTNLSLSNVGNVPVKKLMTPNPETLHERDSVAEAVNKMSLGRYRHIPFLKSDGTYAVASIKSVLKYIAQEDW